MAEMSENKRIAKNSLFLFARMFVTLAVVLYTSRVILSALGVSDFGIYNVVGGIVTMFIFINTAMVNSTQRFLTFELGRNDTERLKLVFSTSINIHAIIAILIVLLCETAGLWFFYNKMVIPEERIDAAFWAFQLSILSSVVSIMSAPYNALIIAHEKMSAFAYMSFLDVGLKLLVAYLLTSYSGERLILYGFLLLLVNILERIIYSIYCRRRFLESKYHYVFDKLLTLEMSKFASWNLLGNFSYACYTQGLNLLLNVFFNPAVNAARGLAVQIQSAITNFSYNVENAIKPQITKTYAQHDLARMHALISASARISYYTLLLISLPVLLEANQILNMWLKEVPEHTVNFVRLTVIVLWIESLSNPLLTATQATGNIKKYQFYVSLLCVLILPLSYIALLFYSQPEIVYIVTMLVGMVVQFVKLWIVGKQVGLSKRKYIQDVFIRTFVVTILSLLLVSPCCFFFKESVIRLCAVVIYGSIIVLIFIYLFGVRKEERIFIIQKTKQIFHNRTSHS